MVDNPELMAKVLGNELTGHQVPILQAEVGRNLVRPMRRPVFFASFLDDYNCAGRAADAEP